MRFRQLAVFACLVFASGTLSNGDAERMCYEVVAVGGRHTDLTTFAACNFRCASCWHRHLLEQILDPNSAYLYEAYEFVRN